MSGSRVRRALAGAMVLTAVAVTACGGPVGRSASPTRTGDLPSVEVRQYKGQKLGAISDFRENSIKGPQEVDRSKYRLLVDGAVESTSEYTYEEVLALPAHEKVVQLDCVEGWSVKALWKGVLLSEMLDTSRPLPRANTVIFHAADGYTTSLPLAYVRTRRILLAYRLNGVELPAADGFPFQVVAEDKWGYKWCRWVTRIELSEDAGYRGYWEQRGYSNSGDRDKESYNPLAP